MAKKTATALVLAGCLVLAGSAAAGCSAAGGSKASSSTANRARLPVHGGNGAAPGAGFAAPDAPDAPDVAAGGGRKAGDLPGADNRFGTELDPTDYPQSTFAMDVDTASYGFARSLIQQGQRPDPGDVRPEEFINSFRQDYPQPEGNGFTVNLDGARLPDSHRPRPSGDVRLLRVGLQTRAESLEQRPDAALTFVIDVSGSMGEPGKLDLVKDALNYLVDQLRPTDSVAIVTFSDQAKVLRPMTPVSQRSQLHAAIDRLETEDSTNLEAGIVKGYDVARGGFRSGLTNRVILLSDGLANQGDTGAAAILGRVKEEAGKQITLLGVGVGGDYGDTLMEQLADDGDGMAVYVSDRQQARQIFVNQLPANLSVRALDAKVQVTFDPSTVAGYRLIGYDDRALPASAFRNDHVDGGEVGPGHSVTALYTVRLRGSASGTVAHAQIRWQDPGTRETNEKGADISVADLNEGFTGASPRLQVSYVAAYFAEALRRSPYGTEVSLQTLAGIAGMAADRTDDSAVADLASVIRRVAG